MVVIDPRLGIQRHFLVDCFGGSRSIADGEFKQRIVAALIADERRLKSAVNNLIREDNNRCLVISTHFLGGYLPISLVKYCFVLRLSPE